MDEETKRLQRSIILENKNMGGSSWKDFTDEELTNLGLAYLISQR